MGRYFFTVLFERTEFRNPIMLSIWIPYWWCISSLSCTSNNTHFKIIFGHVAMPDLRNWIFAWIKLLDLDVNVYFIACWYLKDPKCLFLKATIYLFWLVFSEKTLYIYFCLVFFLELFIALFPGFGIWGTSYSHMYCCGSSDLQLAIALQQQEFEQQPQRPNLPQPSSSGSSRLVTGPQV